MKMNKSLKTDINKVLKSKEPDVMTMTVLILQDYVKEQKQTIFDKFIQYLKSYSVTSEVMPYDMAINSEKKELKKDLKPSDPDDTSTNEELKQDVNALDSLLQMPTTTDWVVGDKYYNNWHALDTKQEAKIIKGFMTYVDN